MSSGSGLPFEKEQFRQHRWLGSSFTGILRRFLELRQLFLQHSRVIHATISPNFRKPQSNLNDSQDAYCAHGSKISSSRRVRANLNVSAFYHDRKLKSSCSSVVPKSMLVVTSKGPSAWTCRARPGRRHCLGRAKELLLSRILLGLPI